jgi:hypothetical protein
MRRPWLSILLVPILVPALALSACGVLPSIPLSSQIVTGNFGGDNVLMTADSTGARLDHGCVRIIVPAPLATDARGTFSLAAVSQRNGGVAPFPDEKPTPVRVDGHATSDAGGTLRLIITSVGLHDTLVVTRDRKTIIFACP